MLAIPTKGIAKSVKVHNVRQNILCDWIESSLVFESVRDSISQMDVVDVLTTEERYTDQDFAIEGVKNAWSEVERRIRCAGSGAPIRINRNRIEKLVSWQECPEYSFCLLLSMKTVYDWWSELEYNNQGELFEMLTFESIVTQFEGWQAWRTGWSPSTPVTFASVAREIMERLNEPPGQLDLWKDQNEMGLDILLYRPFQDDGNGIPVLMVQCASGNNWSEKRGTPDLRKWKNAINFRNHLARAFSMPFCIDKNDFATTCVEVDGLVLDRYRLLSAANQKSDWASSGLRLQLLQWLEPRVATLLEMSNS